MTPAASTASTSSPSTDRHQSQTERFTATAQVRPRPAPPSLSTPRFTSNFTLRSLSHGHPHVPHGADHLAACTSNFLCDEDLTQLPNPIVFTGGTDQPATVSGAPGVALAAGGSRFAVAWADAQSETTGCPECVSGSEIFLTTIPAGGGTRVGEVHVSATALNATSGKYHPAVVWDGVSFAVVWLEYVQGMSRVWLRRYDPQLQPIGPPTWVSKSAPNQPGPNEVGLAVVGPGEYGVAFQMISGTQQELVRVTCNGP